MIWTSYFDLSERLYKKDSVRKRAEENFSLLIFIANFSIPFEVFYIMESFDRSFRLTRGSKIIAELKMIYCIKVKKARVTALSTAASYASPKFTARVEGFALLN